MEKQSLAVENEIRRMATVLGMEVETLTAEIQRKADENGCNFLTALGLVKSENAYLLRRVNGVYRIWPLAVSEVRIANTHNKKTNQDEESEVVDILGMFYGPINKAGKTGGFMQRLSLWRDDVTKATALNLEKPSVFKGSLDLTSGKVYMQRGAEFVDDKKPIPFTEVFTSIKENATHLSDLTNPDDNAQYPWDRQDVLTKGQIADIRPIDEAGERVIIDLTDIGFDIMTVWPPDNFVADKDLIGQDVLVYGFFQVKSGGFQISAKKIILQQ